MYISIAFSYPQMTLMIENLGCGHAEQQRTGKQMDVDSTYPNRIEE